VALQQFDVVVALLVSVHEVSQVKVLVEVDEVLLFLVAEDRVRMARRRPRMFRSVWNGAVKATEEASRFQAGASAVGNLVVEVKDAVDPSRREHPLGERRGDELLDVGAVAE